MAAAAHAFVDRLDDAVTIEGDAGRHLARSLRLRAGETVTVADGRGQWRAYAVAVVGRGSLQLEALGAKTVEPGLTPRLAVAFSITKGAKPDFVVQKLTELGVDEIVLLHAERSVPRWNADRERSAIERLERIAHEAATQCRRARLPLVAGVATPMDVGTRPGLVVADPAGEFAADLDVPAAGEWLLAVGPEGGFGPDELATLAGPRLALGPHVLRAETAAIAGAAVLTARRATDA